MHGYITLRIVSLVTLCRMLHVHAQAAIHFSYYVNQTTLCKYTDIACRMFVLVSSYQKDILKLPANTNLDANTRNQW